MYLYYEYTFPKTFTLIKQYLNYFSCTWTENLRHSLSRLLRSDKQSIGQPSDVIDRNRRLNKHKHIYVLLSIQWDIICNIRYRFLLPPRWAPYEERLNLWLFHCYYLCYSRVSGELLYFNYRLFNPKLKRKSS